jgi:hypothetical protein
MEETVSSETKSNNNKEINKSKYTVNYNVGTYQTAWRHITECHNFNIRLPEDVNKWHGKLTALSNVGQMKLGKTNLVAQSLE